MTTNDKNKFEALYQAEDWRALGIAAKAHTQSHPKDPVGFYYLAQYFRNQAALDAPQKALTCLDKAFRLAPADDVFYSFELAKYLDELEQYASSNLLFDSILKEHPNHYDAKIALGYSSFYQDDLDTAQRVFDSAKNQDGTRPEAWHGLACILDRKGDKAACQTMLDQCLDQALYPKAIDLKLTLLFEEKEALSKAGGSPEQLTAIRQDMFHWFNTYHEVAGPDRPMLLEHAQLLIETTAYTEALSILRQAQKAPMRLSTDPAVDIEELILVVLLLLNQVEEALFQLPQVLTYYLDGNAVLELVEPLYESPQTNASQAGVLGVLWLETDTNKAIAYLTEAIEAFPNVADLRAYRATAYEQTDGPITAWQEVQRITGFTEVGARLQVQLLGDETLRAWLMEQGKDIDALTGKLYEALAVHCPDQMTDQLNYGQYLVAHSAWAQALPYLKRGIELDPDPAAEWLVLLAKAYNQVEDFDAALASAQRALSQRQGYADAHYLCAYALRGLQQYEAALDELEVGQNLESTMVSELDWRHLRNLTWIDLGQGERAKADYQQLVHEGPAHEAATHFGMGYLAYRQGEWDRAYKLLRSAEYLGYSDAVPFLQQHFKAYLAKQKEAMLAQHPNAPQNNQASILRTIFDQVWICEEVMGVDSFDGYSDQLKEIAMEAVKSRGMIWTPQFWLDLTMEAANLHTYHIVAEKGKTVTLGITSIDTGLSSELQVTLSDLESPTTITVSSIGSKGSFIMRPVQSVEDQALYQQLRRQGVERSILDLESMELL